MNLKLNKKKSFADCLSGFSKNIKDLTEVMEREQKNISDIKRKQIELSSQLTVSQKETRDCEVSIKSLQELFPALKG